MRIDAVTALFADLGTAELRLWVERGWVIPDRAGEAWEFHDIDVARVRLVRTLRREMEMGEESLPVVLSLLDRLYDARGVLHRLLAAIERQPPELRTALLKSMEDDGTPAQER
ncbi:MAG: hypothetical protein ACRDL8_09905 [Solirubrobacteraceae bacterium]